MVPNSDGADARGPLTRAPRSRASRLIANALGKFSYGVSDRRDFCEGAKPRQLHFAPWQPRELFALHRSTIFEEEALHLLALSRRSAATILGLALLWVIANRVGVLKADGLLAAACAAELLHRQDDLEDVLRRHRSAFIAEARQANLPPELLAAVVADHHAALTAVRRFADCAGSALGGDLSLGPAQVRISTAVRIDGASYDSISTHTFHRYRSSLLDPNANIRYQARELRFLLDRHARDSPLDAEGLVHDPATMARLITEYRVGRLPTSSFDPYVRRSSAVSTLRFMHAANIEFFNRPRAEVVRMRKAIEDHLTYLNCETRNSTPATCQEWKTSLAYPGGGE